MNDEIRVITPYEWTDVKEKCAIKLAMGMKKTTIARQLSISRQSIYLWLEDLEFAQEVDRLSVMYGLASKAERMRIINAAARQFIKNGEWDVSGFNLVELLREARMQMEGVKLDVLGTLAAINETTGPSTDSEPTGNNSILPEAEQETD